MTEADWKPRTASIEVESDSPTSGINLIVLRARFEQIIHWPRAAGEPDYNYLHMMLCVCGWHLRCLTGDQFVVAELLEFFSALDAGEKCNLESNYSHIQLEFEPLAGGSSDQDDLAWCVRFDLPKVVHPIDERPHGVLELRLKGAFEATNPQVREFRDALFAGMEDLRRIADSRNCSSAFPAGPDENLPPLYGADLGF